MRKILIAFAIVCATGLGVTITDLNAAPPQADEKLATPTKNLEIKKTQGETQFSAKQNHTTTETEPLITSWTDTDGKTHYKNTKPSPSISANQKGIKKSEDIKQTICIPPPQDLQSKSTNGIPSWTDNAGQRHYIDTDNKVYVAVTADKTNTGNKEQTVITTENKIFVPVPIIICPKNQVRIPVMSTMHPVINLATGHIADRVSYTKHPRRITADAPAKVAQKKRLFLSLIS